VRIECAVLCDAASLREGLLNILGAGISQVAFHDFPAPLPITFAFRAVLETRELHEQHALHLELINMYEQERIEAAADLVFYVGPERQQLTEEAALAAPVPLSALVIQRPGRYLIRASFDTHILAMFPLRVNAVEPAQPIDPVRT